jgi:Response regulator containing CheY-like receiver domain and AraC-type DNA-binding domain
MRRIPVMLQLVIIMFIVMVIPTTILTSYSGSSLMEYSEETIAETSLAGLTTSRNFFESALSNLASHAVRLTAPSNFIDSIRYITTFDELNDNYVNVNRALTIFRELRNLSNIVDGVYSTFFYLEDSDYVISTDKGITRLDRYEPIDWLSAAKDQSRGIGGKWYPRRLINGIPVLSYVLPTSNLTTATRGTLVINLRETQISSYLRSSDEGERGYFLLNKDGLIVSSNDKTRLLAQADLPYIQDILTRSLRQGYQIRESEGERQLIVWTSTSRRDWTLVKIYSMDELLARTTSMQRNIFLTTIFMIILTTVVSVILARWLSQPLRKLVTTIRSHPSLGTLTRHNELAFLDDAFRRMQEEEQALHQLLQEREQDARNLTAQRLLRGELAEQYAEVFPEPHYRIAVLSIDRYRHYVSKNSRETRSYHRYLFVQKCADLFPEDVHAQIVYQGDGYFAIVLNGAGLDNVHESLKAALLKISGEAKRLFEHTVTIGVSDVTTDVLSLPDLMTEAVELIKQRIIKGGGHIMYWQEDAGGSHKYIYPTTSERRILNYLETKDIENIYKELEHIRQEIRSVPYISYDNILFIYYQLAGVTIRYMRENALTSRVFAGQSNIYSTLASFDTLEEIEEYMIEFFEEITRSLDQSTNKINHLDRIVQYLQNHYNEDIIFEDMAKEIGISYSYMRKIVSEQTGKSLIDYLNLLRIERSKELLLNMELTISQIAEMIGYHNVQSFNRFFRKYEGMSPSQYRNIKLASGKA